MKTSAAHTFSNLTTTQVEDLAHQYFDISVTAKKLPGELDLNFYLKSDDGREYILKIAHAGEDRQHLEMQHSILQHLEKANSGLQLPGIIACKNGDTILEVEDSSGQRRYLRLLTWVRGRVFAKVNPHTPGLLESLGTACGKLCAALDDFDHPGTRRWLKWDLQRAGWVEPYLPDIVSSDRQSTARYFLDLFRSEVEPVLDTLRHSVIYNDANDNNILVDEDRRDPSVTGLIDFGDAVHTCTICDLAIAISYAAMDKPRPLDAAIHIVRGFHRAFPLREEEVAILYYLIAARLLISVTVSARNRQEFPENEYLQVSEGKAWDLLDKWQNISPSFAHYRFRHACGWEPCPQRKYFDEWQKTKGFTADEIIPFNGVEPARLDLSVGSLQLGNNAEFTGSESFEKTINRMLEVSGSPMGIGGYGEVRPFYTTDDYAVMGNTGPQWRTVHLGTDIWAEAGTPVYAPEDGKIHSFRDNKGECNYGPTIILEHRMAGNRTFYTLYGHLSRESLVGLSAGMPVRKGLQIGTLGAADVNGNWPPHLHFQIMLDPLGMEGDFPGVGFPEEKEVWLGICPDLLSGEGRTATETQTAADILPSRSRHLGPNLSISYQKPLHIVRGYQQYLYDHTARRYLDTVNNVAHVGHQHPRVVRAGQRQMAVLNTNTRYLHGEIVRYAEELAATLPPALSVVYFVNSGSEANELALRMMQAYTGHTDIIAVEAGYHGNTSGCIDISSYKFDGKGGRGAPAHTHIVTMPDSFRGIYRNDPDAGKKYAAHVGQAIRKIQEQGRDAGGFICESILSCGGQVVLPEGYLREVYKIIREAGGLCIADEVQVGFGRVGSAFWGFEMEGVVPDIVTMGKPIGNGHPLAAVVTTPAIADAFSNGMEYFNTFGGNPVSCAIGREVLKVIREEGLQENAFETGRYLLDGLTGLKSRHAVIGDVRGRGLFLGVELVTDRESLEPAAAQADYLINRMREHGILMSTDGPFHNVLKLKPPLCFGKLHADFLLAMLSSVLEEDFLQVN